MKLAEYFYLSAQSVSISKMIYAFLFLIGLSFGSFVNALVWRLHKKRNFVSERSECTHCHHALAWYDLLPVVSWVLLKGRCRYCKKRIEDTPLAELVTAGLFVISYMAWPYGFEASGTVLFVLWLLSLVILVALALYDWKWMLLPDKLTFPLIGIGAVMSMVRYAWVEQLIWHQALLEIALGLASIAGLYALLYAASKGAWVGFGDVKLAVFIGLVLSWQQGLLAVFLANFFALLVVLPGLFSKKVKTTSRVPFGPFLILGCIVAFLWGSALLEWYLKNTLTL